jgi:hypothetical protein
MPRRWDRLMPVLIIGIVTLAAGCATQKELTPLQAAETPLIAKGRALFNDVKLSAGASGRAHRVIRTTVTPTTKPMSG